MVLINKYYRDSEDGVCKIVPISTSLKKALIDIVKQTLLSRVDKNINLKNILVSILKPDGDASLCENGINDLFFIPSLYKKNISHTMVNIIYKPSFGHITKLTIENLKGDFAILDPTEEIEPNSLKMTLEFEDYNLQSMKELVSRDLKRKGGQKLEGFSFPVTVYSPGLDCEIKVGFVEIQSKESKAIFISKVLEAVNQFNEANEQGEDSKGLIHNVLKIKSEKTNSDNLTFVVDLGSAGEEGLNVFFKAFEESLIEIDFVEVK